MAEDYTAYQQRLKELRKKANDRYEFEMDRIILEEKRVAEALKLQHIEAIAAAYHQEEPNMVTNRSYPINPPETMPLAAPPTAPIQAPSAEDLEMQIRSISIERAGNKLILPTNMPPALAIEAIKLMMAADSKPVDLQYDFQMTVPDGALALFNALNDLYGFVQLMDTPGFFGSTPPQLLTVEVSPGVTQMIPWGRFRVPSLQGHLQTSIKWMNSSPFFHLTASIPAGARLDVQRIVDHMKANRKSIYKGHAIKLRFPDQEDEPPAHDFFPKFMTVPVIPESNLIFSRDLHDIVDMALFTPIKKTEFCREHGISRKRTILLEGPPGVGKTLTATIVATMGPQHGWTFAQVDSVHDLVKAYRFAIENQPCIISCEDLDLVLKKTQDRDGLINEILNEIDGLESKEQEILLVLTTNFVDRITTEALRPGRIDTVVPVRPPDADAVVRLILLYAGDTLAPTEDLTRAGQLLAGKNAAVVREVVERSKLSAVRRLTEHGQRLTLTARDIEVAAVGMEAHNKLLEPTPIDRRSDIEKGATVIANALVAQAVTFAGPPRVNLPGGSPNGATEPFPVTYTQGSPPPGSYTQPGGMPPPEG
jgi:transitional endoplasmic reticulum ATPase